MTQGRFQDRFILAAKQQSRWCRKPGTAGPSVVCCSATELLTLLGWALIDANKQVGYWQQLGLNKALFTSNDGN